MNLYIISFTDVHGGRERILARMNEVQARRVESFFKGVGHVKEWEIHKLEGEPLKFSEVLISIDDYFDAF